MARVLLIHGSCFGAWAWDAVLPELAALGHDAAAIDLPGRGGGLCTLADQVLAVGAALAQPAVLIGHSAGGMVISAAASAFPARVRGLIHIAAYIPRDGLSLADLRRAGPSQPMRGAFEVTADHSAYGFAPSRCENLFFHDYPDAYSATARLCLEPIAPQETPVASPPPLPRAAVICTEDRAIPPDYQRQMSAGMAQYDLPSGHCPFLSMPQRLAETLQAILNQMENATPSVAS